MLSKTIRRSKAFIHPALLIVIVAVAVSLVGGFLVLTRHSIVSTKATPEKPVVNTEPTTWPVVPDGTAPNVSVNDLVYTDEEILVGVKADNDVAANKAKDIDVNATITEKKEIISTYTKQDGSTGECSRTGYNVLLPSFGASIELPTFYDCRVPAGDAGGIVLKSGNSRVVYEKDAVLIYAYDLQSSSSRIGQTSFCLGSPLDMTVYMSGNPQIPLASVLLDSKGRVVSFGPPSCIELIYKIPIGDEAVAILSDLAADIAKQLFITKFLN